MGLTETNPPKINICAKVGVPALTTRCPRGVWWSSKVSPFQTFGTSHERLTRHDPQSNDGAAIILMGYS